MAEILRYNEITSDEDYKKAAELVKTLSRFNGYFCGKCKHRVYSVPTNYEGVIMDSVTFCENCGDKLNSHEHIKGMIYRCDECDNDHHYQERHEPEEFLRKREYCGSCGGKITPKEATLRFDTRYHVIF